MRVVEISSLLKVIMPTPMTGGVLLVDILLGIKYIKYPSSRNSGRDPLELRLSCSFTLNNLNLYQAQRLRDSLINSYLSCEDTACRLCPQDVHFLAEANFGSA